MGEKHTKDPITIVESQWGNLVITSPGGTPEKKKREAAKQLRKVYRGISSISRDTQGNLTFRGIGADSFDIAAYSLLEKEGLLGSGGNKQK